VSIARPQPEPKAERLLQAMGFHQGGVAEHDLAKAICHHTSGFQHNGPMTEVKGHLEVMSGDKLGTVQAPDKFHESAPAAWIEIGRRLVEQQYRRTARQNTR
jgi:hypothetical protein